jgi:hypothetical protein
MKLDVDVNEVVLSNVGTTGEFRIKNSAKAFKILSDGLYSNKIRAIIRELSCNAVDSHMAAGKQQVPFEVHLPTILEPWFAVRDFGTGLDGNQVVNIYTTYFESTKTDSNDFIGALGLGSKSPFSYTENFTVTAVKAGVKRIYSAFINEMGIPCVAEMQEELTEDPNGVEVKFSVTDKYDYNSFRHEAQNVFRWFKLKPIVTGVDGFEHIENKFKEENIVPGVHIKGNGRDESTAVMGNIAYPLSKISQPEKYFGGLANLLTCGLVLEFGIGELDFAASREELSYVPLTMNSIKTKLEALNAQLAVHLTQKANAITCEWARAEYLREEARSVLFKEAVVKYVRDTKFALYDPAEYYGKKTFKYLVKDLAANKMEIRGMRVHGSTCSKAGYDRDYDSTAHAYIDMVKIPCETDVVIVLNDLKTGIYARARYHFVNKEKPLKKHSIQVYCVSYDDPDMAVRQKHYDQLLKELHNPPIVIMASTLEKEVRVKNPAAIGTQGLMTLEKREEYSRGRPDYVWRPVAQEPDKKSRHYYVCLNNWEPVCQDGVTPFDITGLKANLDQCGIPELNNIVVIGVRKNRIKDIKDLKNWVWIEDKVREEMAKITTAQVEAVVAAETLDNYSTKVYTSWDAAKLAGQDSAYTKYLNKYSKIQRKPDTSVPILVELCAKFGKTFVVETIKQQIITEREALYNRYPMLKYLIHSSVTGADLAHYISLVDNQDSIPKPG